MDACRACFNASLRQPIGSPQEASSVGRGSVYGYWTNKVVLHQELHAPSPLRWVRIFGGLMVSLMMFWMDRGS